MLRVHKILDSLVVDRGSDCGAACQLLRVRNPEGFQSTCAELLEATCDLRVENEREKFAFDRKHQGDGCNPSLTCVDL